MKIDFKPLSFDGLKRTCRKYKVTTAKSAAGTRRALRCETFEKASKVGKHPVCDMRLKDGGRSPGLIHNTGAAGCTKMKLVKPKSLKKNKKRAKRESKRR